MMNVFVIVKKDTWIRACIMSSQLYTPHSPLGTNIGVGTDATVLEK